MRRFRVCSLLTLLCLSGGTSRRSGRQRHDRPPPEHGPSLRPHFKHPLRRRFRLRLSVGAAFIGHMSFDVGPGSAPVLLSVPA
jgi:hypothetical protein